MLSDERVGLEIEEQVARRWFGQRGHSKANLHGEHLEFALARFATFKLQARLLAHPKIGAGRATLRLPLQRKWEERKIAESMNPALPKFVDLHLGDPGDQAEVVIIPTPLFASRAPPANLAMILRVGVGCFSLPTL